MLKFSLRVMARAVQVAALAAGAACAGSYGFFQIAEIPAVPRTSSMGGAGVALAGGGFGVYNPASPAFAEAPFLSLEFGSEPGDLSKARIESSWMFPKWFAGASLQVRSTGFFITNERTDETTMQNAPAFDQALLATATGGYIFGRLAAGGSFNFFQERIGDQLWHALTFSPGVLFELVPNSITLGASLSHYLRVDTTVSPWYKTPLIWYRSAKGYPRYARAGVAWRDTVRRWALPFTTACDFMYSDVYERLMIPIGAEVWMLPSLAARAGVCINHPADIVHFGIGLRMQNLRFDVDYGVFRAVFDNEAKWLFGFSYQIKSKKESASVQKKREEPAPTLPQQIPEPVKAAHVPETAGDSSGVTVPPKDTTAAVPEIAADSTRSPQTSVPPSAQPPDSLLSPAGVRDTVAR
jgi:hypothetical protein